MSRVGAQGNGGTHLAHPTPASLGTSLNVVAPAFIKFHPGPFLRPFDARDRGDEGGNGEAGGDNQAD